ncbi:MAG TPA: CPBP family intramembrane glutamic endopeptidase [Myxococcota bacterium]|nr:CPBP family intramembrane glutamic endopeptidase [Myxococcota bacterium]
MSQPRLIPIALILYTAMAVVAWVWRRALRGEPLLYAGGAPAGLDPIRDVAIGLAAAILLVVLSRWLTLRTRAGEALARRLAETLGPLSLAEIAVLAAASGIGEELFFRGALQPRVGLVAASLLFGAAHLVPSRPLALWSVFACAAGLLFGALFERTGNLVAPIVAHAAVNALNLRWLVRRHARGWHPETHSRN